MLALLKTRVLFQIIKVLMMHLPMLKFFQLDANYSFIYINEAKIIHAAPSFKEVQFPDVIIC